MRPRALLHTKGGKAVLKEKRNQPGVYVLYREDVPYHIGKTGTRLLNSSDRDPLAWPAESLCILPD